MPFIWLVQTSLLRTDVFPAVCIGRTSASPVKQRHDEKLDAHKPEQHPERGASAGVSEEPPGRMFLYGGLDAPADRIADRTPELKRAVEVISKNDMTG
jgi:hypothetical protein